MTFFLDFSILLNYTICRKEVNILHERIKKIRKELDLTQQEFADKLAVKRNTVGQWEIGRNSLTDSAILSICREFNVDETWLRTGEGEMFKKISREQDIALLTKQLLDEEEDSFKNRLISVLAHLPVESWEVLEQIAIALADKKDDKED